MTTSLEQSRTHLLHATAGLAHRSAADGLEPFLSRYYRHVATEDLLAREPEDLLGAALSHRDLARERAVGTANVVAFNPTVESQGWASGHTVVQIVTRRHALPRRLGDHGDQPARSARSTSSCTRRCSSGATSWATSRRSSTSRPNPTGEFGVARRVVDAPGDRPAQRSRRSGGAGRRAARGPAGRARLGRGLAEDACPRREPRRGAVRIATGTGWRRRRSTAPFDFLDLGGGQPLHLPRLPAVHPRTARRATTCSCPFPAAAWACCATTAARGQLGLPAHCGRPGAGTGQGTADHHQGQLPGDGAPAGLPRLHRGQDLRRGRRGHRRAPLPRPVRGGGIHRVHRRHPDHRRSGPGGHRQAGLPARQPLGQGPAADPRELPARRVVPDRRRAAGRDRRVRHAPAGADPHQAVPAPGHLRPVHRPRWSSCPATATTRPCRLRIEALLRGAFGVESVDYTTRVTDAPLAQVHFVLHVGKGKVLTGGRRGRASSARSSRPPAPGTRTSSKRRATEHGEEAGARIAGLYGKSFPEAYKEDFHPRIAIADLKRIEALDSPRRDRAEHVPRAGRRRGTSGGSSSTAEDPCR